MDIWQKYDTDYEIKTYDDVKKVYSWIVRAVQKLEIQDLKVNVSILFSSGKLTYSCKNMQEFTNAAYGLDDFKLDMVDITIHENRTEICLITYRWWMTIHSDSKDKLEKIIYLLNSTPFEEEGEKLQNNTYIQNQYNNSGIVINGEGNIVRDNIVINGSENKISNNKSDDEKNKTGILEWIRGIMQGVLANLVCWLIPVIITALIAYFALKK